MKTKSQLIVSFAFALTPLLGCTSVEQKKSAETQPAEKAQLVEAAFSPKEAAPAKSAEPTAKALPEQSGIKSSQELPATLPDHYVVAAGDTLAKIAARPDVYGDARLWPLLHGANSRQIGPQGLIFPNQVLTINRNYTAEDVKALTGRPRLATRPVPPSKRAEEKNTGAPAVADKPSVAAPAATEKAQEVAAAKPREAAKPADYLNAARRAFAAGDTPWAIHYYNAHLAVQKRDANAWGELGNVYYAEGMLPDSAQAYFNAANILIDRGLTARAMQLMPAIEEGNPGLAQAIYLRLTTVRK